MHKTLEELQGLIDEAKEKVEIGGIYFHYKSPDKHYRVTDVVIFEETEEPAVVYQALYGTNMTWVRKISSWIEEVEVEGGKAPRFQKNS